MEYIEGLLSVCIGCYNHEKYIEDCIQSVWDNDYKNVEIIVIDDGSTDKSVDILKEMQAKSPCKFEIISQENTHNIGLNGNRVLKKAKGEFVTFMSSDDYYTNDAFSNKLNLMLNDKNIAFIVSQKVYEKRVNGEIILGDPVGERCFSSETSIDDMCEIEYNEGTFAVQGNIFRREIIDAVNGFDEDIYGDDIIIRTKVLQYMKSNSQWTFKVISEPSFVYRKHEGSYSEDVRVLTNILLDTYDRYWPDRDYAEYVKNVCLNLLKSCTLEECMQMCSKHPRLLNYIYADNTALGYFYTCIKKHLGLKFVLWYIFRKETYHNNRVKFVILNCIKISFRNKEAKNK